MAKRKDWTADELAVILETYFRILNAESRGGRVNKAAICREVLPRLNGRTRGSYEMKMMNVSAAMVAAGLPTIDGYKPYGHAQKALIQAVARFAQQVAA